MKRIITSIIAIYTFFALCMGQNVAQDTIVVETDSGVVEWVDVPDNNNSESRSNRVSIDNPFDIDFGVGGKNWVTTIIIVSLLAVFGLPALIIFLVFYFQYKNRKAKYKLAEQALASGQPIPEEVVKAATADDTNLQNKGIKNIFLGIGLAIFFWAIVGLEFGAIGLLIMFTGVGQWVIYYVNKDKGNK